MERYTVNGHEIEYDTFDIDNLEIYDRETRRIEEMVKGVRADSENYVSVLREICNAVLDFFDTVVGEGTAHDIFGDRVNFRDIIKGFREFSDGVAKEMREAMPGANRETRRHAK